MAYVLGIGGIVLAVVYAGGAYLLAKDGDAVGRDTGICHLVSAVLAIVEAVIGFGTRDPGRRVRMRRLALLVLAFLLVLLVTGVVCVVLESRAGEQGDVVTAMSSWAPDVIPLVMFDTWALLNTRSASASEAAWEATGPLSESDRRLRQRIAVGLLLIDVLVVVLVLLMVGPSTPGYGGYQGIWILALLAALVMAPVVMANRRGCPRPDGTGWRIAVLLLWILSFLGVLAMLAMVLGSFMGMAMHDNDAGLLVVSVVGLFAAMVSGLIVGRTWMAWHEARRSGRSSVAPTQ